MAKVKNISKRVFNGVKPGGTLETKYPDYYALNWFEVLDKTITQKQETPKTEDNWDDPQKTEDKLENLTINELKELAEEKDIEIPKEITRKADIIEFIKGLDE